MPVDPDPEPELAPFRAEERRRAAAKKQDFLTQVFNVSVGAPLTALAVSSGMLDHKGVPRLVAAASASGTIYLYDRVGELWVIRANGGRARRAALCEARTKAKVV